ncbi:diaminopimelate decarboxylase [Candidatus Kapabacteria bacterium]|nr:diaminopimelate decarboxylase [Candidatus Kapabacteria bacterium]
MEKINNLDIKDLTNQFGSPLYVYDSDRIEANYKRLKTALTDHYPNNNIHFSVKANSNLSILDIFRRNGSGADCSSPTELRLALMAGFDREDILYTGNYESYEDLEYVSSIKGIKLNLDDITSLERILKFGVPERISFRINPGIGRGGFEGITTAGSDAKFGIPYEKAAEAYKMALDAGVKRFGIHMMTGSNNLEPYYFAEVVDKLLIIAGDIFPELGIKPEFIDIGGGQGIPYRDDEDPLNVDLMAKLIAKIIKERCQSYDFGLPQLLLEPGRYLAADAGYLIAKVTGIKNGYKKFIGLDAGMGTLVRQSLYGAFHRMEVYGKNSDFENVNICGQICENSDIFAKNIRLPKMDIGDLVTFKDTGAYGFVMSSVYNNRTRPAEVLIENGKPILIRKRESFDDILRLYPEEILQKYNS